MKTKILRPKMISLLFFIIYALLFSIFIRYTIYPVMDKTFHPLIPSLTTALLTAAFLGFAFSNLLQKKNHWFRLLCIGFLMAICAILLTSLIVYLYAWHGHAQIFKPNRPWEAYFVIYGTIVTLITIMIGIWLVPLTGVVAIYFNKRFLPALLHFQNKSRLPNKTTTPSPPHK